MRTWARGRGLAHHPVESLFQVQDQRDPDPVPTDARLSAAHVGVDRDAVQELVSLHVERLRRPGNEQAAQWPTRAAGWRRTFRPIDRAATRQPRSRPSFATVLPEGVAASGGSAVLASRADRTSGRGAEDVPRKRSGSGASLPTWPPVEGGGCPDGRLSAQRATQLPHLMRQSPSRPGRRCASRRGCSR